MALLAKLSTLSKERYRGAAAQTCELAYSHIKTTGRRCIEGAHFSTRCVLFACVLIALTFHRPVSLKSP